MICFGDNLQTVQPLLQIFVQPLILTGGTIANLGSIGVIFSWVQ